jgi:hypothetical protein
MKLTDSAKDSSLFVLPFKVDHSLPSAFLQGHFDFCDLSSGFLVKEVNASLDCLYSLQFKQCIDFHLNCLIVKKLLTFSFLPFVLDVWGVFRFLHSGI